MSLDGEANQDNDDDDLLSLMDKASWTTNLNLYYLVYFCSDSSYFWNKFLFDKSWLLFDFFIEINHINVFTDFQYIKDFLITNSFESLPKPKHSQAINNIINYKSP
jgi:hypothetical protein